jgi:small subunit ribosomal protein S17
MPEEETQNDVADPEPEAEERVAEAEPVEPVASAEPVEEQAEATADEPAEEPEAEEPVAEAEPAAEPEAEPAEEPAAEAEPPAEPEAEPAEEPAAEAEPAPEPAAEAEEPAAAEPAPASASVKRKRKRLPRALRRQRVKPKREKPAERRPITRAPKPEHARGRRQERQGTVVSASSDKTIVVRVDMVKLHPMYKKVIKRSTKLHAHDERNEAKVGDVVRIVETRPLSKLKRWRLQQIVEEAK